MSPAARLVGFVGQLRHNGFALGPRETELAATVLAAGPRADAGAARLALKIVLSGDRARWQRFDELFDAYWLGRGVRQAMRTSGADPAATDRRPPIWDGALPSAATGEAAQPTTHGAAASEADEAPDGSGRRIASRSERLSRADLRNLVSREDREEAERIAERLARAIRYRLSRRRIAGRHGLSIDLRRTIRCSLGRGGEPLELLFKRRPERPVKLVILLDVSGSMAVYSRYLLAFVRGLVGRWLHADAFLFHTRLVRVTDALRESDHGRAMDRLGLMAEGFGGGTRIAGAVEHFNERYARECIDSRTVVILLSDGYDTDPPALLASALAQLKRRARRLVWLNPLLGWRDYAPVARAMAAALPFIDCFAAAHTLESLAALEGELARL